jgi:hypothetical protein
MGDRRDGKKSVDGKKKEEKKVTTHDTRALFLEKFEEMYVSICYQGNVPA